MAFTDRPCVSELRRLFKYCPVTGHIYANPVKKEGRPRKSGPQGRINGAGHIQICVSNTRFPAHHIAWALHYGKWPKSMLDHINGVRTDNRITNLREATGSENCCNAVRYKSNTTGVKGVTFSKGKFVARIWLNRKAIYVGAFSSLEAAASARLVAQRQLHKDFECSRGNII